MSYRNDLRELERQQRKIDRALRALAAHFGMLDANNSDDANSKHKRLHKMLDALYDYDFHDSVYMPKKPTYAIAFFFFAISAYLFACAITHDITDPTQQTVFVPYMGDPWGIIVPVVTCICGFLIAAWSHVVQSFVTMKENMIRRKERRFLRKFRHIDGILSRECNHVLLDVIYDKRHSRRISGDYLLVHDAGFLLNVLSLGRTEDKTTMIQGLCYPKATTKTYSLTASKEHVNAGKEFLSELEAVCRIWAHSLQVAEYGKLVYCPHSKKSRARIQTETTRLAKELGVDQALELYYDGVPVADIVC